jgi:ferredoxin--NADP+ reductase
MQWPFETQFKVRVLYNEIINHTSGLIRFRRDFTFKAGQVISLTTHPEIAPRLYSIASGEEEENIEILYKIVPFGELTPRLIDLRRGESLFISQPFGEFLAFSVSAFFIATGTGIAPFISMIRSGNTLNKTLIHGSRELKGFYYSDYLKLLLKDKYIRCYTGLENVSLFRGRVTEYITGHDNLQTNIKYYLCGSTEMVVDTREILMRRGIPFHNILSEIYF